MSDENWVKAFGRRDGMFLRFLSETAKVAHSWRLAGGQENSITHLYARKRKEREFAAAWAQAMEMAGDRFEEEAARRAVEGVKRDIYYKGEVVGSEQQYSDGLLSKLLDGSKPDKYAPKRENTQVNVQVGLAVIPMTAPSLDAWEKQSIAHQASEPPMIDITPKQPVPAIASKKVIVV